MRSVLYLWMAAIAMVIAGVGIMSSRFIAARARAGSAEARLTEIVNSRARLADLRKQLPAWTTLRPSEGLAPRVADSLAAAGLPASTMANLSAQAETIVVSPVPSFAANSGLDPARRGEGGGMGGVKSRKAGITLSPITLSQLGRFVEAWREREPAWVISTMDLTPIVGQPGDRASSSTSVRPEPFSAGKGGGDLPLRVVLTIESLWLDVPSAEALPSTVSSSTSPVPLPVR